MSGSSGEGEPDASRAQIVRRPPDGVDRRLLALLRDDARLSNARLAAEVGLAPSSCLARVRALIASGAVAGFRARLDPKALGFGLEALIGVSIKSGARQRISRFAQEVRLLPEVTQVFFLGGAEDFMLHVVARDADHMRDFVVEHLSGHAAVASTRTSLVFEHEDLGLRAL